MNNTSLTALGGIITALSVFIMFLAGIIPNLTYVIPAICGLLLIFTIQEAELKWSVFIYIAVSLLSLLIVADKEAVIMYIFFFGYYPIAKDIYERKLTSKALCYLVKFVTFNVAIVIGYLLLIYIFMIPIEGMDRLGKWTPLALLGLGNVVFLIYDWLCTRLIVLYREKYHDRIRRSFGGTRSGRR
ncbi:MAG: hypothetical protein IJ133_01005 [Clostridia bacterium]|nr:hypothetical protein [Clostridia bacterium]